MSRVNLKVSDDFITIEKPYENDKRYTSKFKITVEHVFGEEALQ